MMQKILVFGGPPTPPPPRGLPPMEVIGVTAIIGKRVCQKILADATIMAVQPPATNQTVLEATIKRDIMIMRTATARVFGTMAGIHSEVTRPVTAARHLTTGSPFELVGQQHRVVRQLNTMLQGHQAGPETTTCAVPTTEIGTPWLV